MFALLKKTPKQINIVDYSHENNKKSVFFPCSHKPLQSADADKF